MPPVAREAFLAELRALPAERQAAFLAALSEARGRRVDRDDTRLRIGPPEGRTVVVPGDDDRAVDDGIVDRDADAVLVLGDDPGADRRIPGRADRIDGTEVYHEALYAIDRSDCERLVRRFFDRPLSSFADGDARPDRVGGETNDDGAGGEREGRPNPVAGSGAIEGMGAGRPARRTAGAAATETASGRGDVTRGPADPNAGDGTDHDGAAGAGPMGRRKWRRLAAIVGLVGILGFALVGTGAVPGTVLTPEPADAADGPDGAGTLTAVEPTAGNGTGPVAAAGGSTRTPGRGDTVFDVDRAGTATPAPESGTAEPPARGVGDGDGRLPPGVSASGAIDEATLAEAHLAALANRSFRLTLVYREFVDGRPGGMRREVLRVEGPDRYRVDTYASGEFRTDPVALAGGDVYANGSSVARRAGEDRPGALPRGDAVEPGTDGAVPYGDAIGQYLRWYLSVEESTLAGRTVAGEPAYWLTIDGDPWIGSENTTGSALVARDGTVRELRRASEDPDHPGTEVVVTIRVTDVGSTTVRPPEWYEDEGAGTARGTPVTATATPAESGDAGEGRRSGG